MTRPLRLLAGTLALALPLTAAAACGTQKRASVKQELAAAQSALGHSKAAAFTLRLEDPKGSLAAAAKGHDATPSVAMQALLKGSITFVVDPAGDRTLDSAPSTSDLSAVNVAVIVKDDRATVAELRVVGSNLYAQLNVAELDRLSTGAFSQGLDQAGQGTPAPLAQALTALRSGGWVELPLAPYLDKLKGLSKSKTHKASDYKGLGSRLFAAVKPFVTVTDASDSSSDRVLDVRVKAKSALHALLGVLGKEKGLPFGGALSKDKIGKDLTNGEAHGTITLHDGHLNQVALDLESIRGLAADAKAPHVAGAQLLLDVNDAADPLAAPKGATVIDLSALFDQFLPMFTGGKMMAPALGISMAG